ncbi:MULTISPECIES: CAP domain-containing protein [Streptomyces]|uniref:Cysteine-rich secretory protein family protein n=1 Tax=Streptomyces chartreusis NRRL 3882 TaxID=1079985 RepID=A0A2N9B623_STRCX|nr:MULTISPECIES: CAP domain-containing protein [Streptomyces]MYS93986.1 CAP domain-containing protein [Streptomyces sp. SID5464]SOR78776.1 Cysteine-rich secretory protein family protein [Streptomyces chartreusis NRRL 3882]
MGRHRRSAAGRAATGRATAITQADGSVAGHDPLHSPMGDGPAMGIAPYLNPDAYAGTYAKSEAYLFATGASEPGDGYDARNADAAVFAGDGFAPDGGARRSGSHRRRKKTARPMRTGLLGVSAAVALGTVAVATGAVPGLENFQLGGGGGADKVQAGDTPTNSPIEQGGTTGSADGRDSVPPSRDAERSLSPSPSASKSSAAPTKAPEKKKPEKPQKETPEQKKPTTTPSEKPDNTPSRTATKAPEKPSASAALSEESAAAAQVLRLVNEERAKVGCSAVAANSALTELAQNYSEDMAARGFFDHTDPNGRTPWDRAGKAGISNLGGENIARGQADAAAVMDAWMNSPGHRANILNCDFKTLGVGVEFGSGGPWWTQDFGY